MEINSLGNGGHEFSNAGMQNSKECKVDLKATNGEIIISSPSNEKDKVRNISEKQIKNIVDNLNKKIDKEDIHSTHIEYEKHKILNEFIIKIVDNDTKKVIKEIPPKQILDLVAKFCEMAGILVDKKA